MKVNIESIKENLGQMITDEMDVSLSVKKIQGREIKFINPGKLDLTVVNSDKEYVITGTGEILLELPCSRCLELFEMPLKFDFNYQISKEEVTDDEIDITDPLLEQIRLAIPMQSICNEECEGLCPSCGINLNHETCDCMMHEVDPRLAKLEKLLDQE